MCIRDSLKLMNELREKNGTAVLFITHDLGVINQMADNVAVMYCGQVVEYAPAETIFHKSVYSHPYTEGRVSYTHLLGSPGRGAGSAQPRLRGCCRFA